MYPADDFGSSSDLPDTITFNATNLSRFETNYGNTENGVILEGNLWVRYINNEAVSTARCLISQPVDLDPATCNSGIVRDNFSSSYYLTSTLTATGGGQLFCSGTVYRTGSNPELQENCCAWAQDPEECLIPEGLAALFYDGVSDVIGEVPTYKWVIAAGPEPIIGIKTGSQNSPIGNYTNGFSIS